MARALYLGMVMTKTIVSFVFLMLASTAAHAQVRSLFYKYKIEEGTGSHDSVVVKDSADLNPFFGADTQFTVTVWGMGQTYRFDLIKDGAKSKGIVTAYTYCIRDEEIERKESTTTTGLKVTSKRSWELVLRKTLLEKSFCDSLWAYALQLEMDSLPTYNELKKEIGFTQLHGIYFGADLGLNGVQHSYATSWLYIDSSNALTAFRPVRSLAMGYLSSHPSLAVPYDEPGVVYNSGSIQWYMSGAVKPETYEPLEIDWSDTFLGY